MTHQFGGNQSFWKELSKDVSSGVMCVQRSLHLSFPPYYLADIRNSVKSVVDSRLNHYEEELGGILAGYGKIAILASNAQTLFNLIDIHVNVKGDFYVFNPKVGTQLTGVVNNLASGHIGCLVHGLFNVSLPQPATIYYRDWLGKDAKLQDIVTFTITKVDLQSDVPYIEGNITKKNTASEVLSSHQRSLSDSGVASEDSASDTVVEGQKKKKSLTRQKTKNETPAIKAGDNDVLPDVKVETISDDEKQDAITPQKKSGKKKKEEEPKLEPAQVDVLDNEKKRKRLSTAPELVDTPDRQKKPKKKKTKVMEPSAEAEQAEVVLSEQIADRLSVLEIEKKRKRLSIGQEMIETPKSKRPKHPDGQDGLPASKELFTAASDGKAVPAPSQVDMVSSTKMTKAEKKRNKSQSATPSTEMSLSESHDVTDSHNEKDIGSSVKSKKKNKKKGYEVSVKADQESLIQEILNSSKSLSTPTTTTSKSSSSKKKRSIS